MDSWGAKAAMKWPVVAPLHAAGFAVLLIDARCHGRSDDERFTSMHRFAEDIAAGPGLAWLRLQPDVAAERMALLGPFGRRRRRTAARVASPRCAGRGQLVGLRPPT